MKLNKKPIYSTISMASNLILPLAATPFLLKALGENYFGELVVVQAATLFICQIIDFGFSLGAAREVAIQKNNYDISQVYSKYQNARFILLLISFLIAISLIFFELIPGSFGFFATMFFPFAVGVFLQANWFFHGRAEYGWLAFANLAGKSIYFIVSINVSDKYDMYFAGMAFGVSQLITGFILQFALIRMKIKFEFCVELMSNIKTILSGASNFAAIALLSIHTQLIIILTGNLVSVKSAGDVSILDKATRAMAAIMFPLANSSFSRLSKLYHCDINSANNLHKRLEKILVAFSIISSLIIFLFAEGMYFYFYKIQNNIIHDLIMIATPLPIFLAIGLLHGGLKLIPIGLNRLYFNSVFLGEICGLVVFFIVLNINKDLAGMMAIVVAELIMALAMYFSTKIKERNRN